MVKININKVAVIGAGVMGAGIAAHLANCGLEVLLLDIVPDAIPEENKKDPDWKNLLARNGVEGLLRSKRPVFTSQESYKRVQVGNLEDNLGDLSEYDWIIETIIERIDIKKQLFEKIEKVRRNDCIVTTNTSGIPIAQISSEFSAGLKQHFLGTHFFNPPTYAKLVEIIPNRDTKPEVVELINQIMKTKLNKKPVVAKDTPNFIANRLGLVSALHVLHLSKEKGYSVEEVDAVCGIAMGRMSTPVYKMIDAIGLDTVKNVINNLSQNAHNDEKFASFFLPDFAVYMLENGLLGDKVGKGFYFRDGEKDMVFDIKTMSYREKLMPTYPSLQAAAEMDSPAKKVKTLINSDDPASWLAWKVLSYDLCYTANRMGEIADNIIEIDTAMKWGYQWRLGPFECWDAIGVAESVKRMEADGQAVPTNIKEMLGKGGDCFYRSIDGVKLYYDFKSKSYCETS